MGVEPPTGEATGESSSISTSRGGAEHVLFEASLEGVGGDTKFWPASTSHTDSESPEAAVWAGKAVSADAIIFNFFFVLDKSFFHTKKRFFRDQTLSMSKLTQKTNAWMSIDPLGLSLVHPLIRGSSAFVFICFAPHTKK